MADPVRLHQPEAIPDIVETIERLLQEARAGEIIGFAYAAATRRGDACSGWTSTASMHCLKSAVMNLFARLGMHGMGD